MRAQQRPAAIERLDTIDFLRGIAVLGVVYLHIAGTLAYLVDPKAVPLWLHTAYGDYGGMGVPCFFAVSGFLITLNSIRRYGSLAALKPRTFYRIRFARIAPALLLLLSILSGLHLARFRLFAINPQVSTLPRAIFTVLTFQFNHEQAMRGWFPPSWVPLWTLSVEEMFYLCFPLLCVLLLRRRWSTPLFFISLGAFVVIGPFARCSPAGQWAQYSYLGNMDGIALGCMTGLLAASMLDRTVWKQPVVLWTMRLVGVALMVLADASALLKHPALFAVQSLLWKTSTGATILGLGTCLVMMASVVDPRPGFWFTAPVRLVGRYSYEVYLYHSLVVIGLILIYNRVPQSSLTMWAVAMLLISGLLGFAISHLVSEPMNQFLRGARLPSQLRAVGERRSSAG